jgi:HK97 gp10 family phage protein
MTAVIGVPELLARFARAAALAEVAEKAAIDTLGNEVEVTAQAAAPVDTGALRDSIVYSDGVVSVGVDYAGFVEYGTSDTPAQPYLRPAADTADGEAAATIAAAVMRTA